MISDARQVVDAAMSEADFQQQIIEAAEACGWWVFHDTDSRRNRAGFPDLMLLRGIDLLFLELKAKGGRVRPEQQEVIGRLKQVRRVHADVAYPRDWPEIEAVLRSRVR